MTSDTLAPGGVTAPAASATAPGDTTASGAPSLVASERPQAPSPDAPGVRVLGIRHHGPGSSRALVGALEDYQPDCVLEEGPADADDLIEWVGPQMTPPVALLAWQTDAPSHSAFWPMAVFSPEWQALRWAGAHGVRAQFMDLPAAALPPYDLLPVDPTLTPESGCLSSAKAASAEKGAILADSIVSGITDAIRGRFTM